MKLFEKFTGDSQRKAFFANRKKPGSLGVSQAGTSFFKTSGGTVIKRLSNFKGEVSVDKKTEQELSTPGSSLRKSIAKALRRARKTPSREVETQRDGVRFDNSISHILASARSKKVGGRKIYLR